MKLLTRREAAELLRLHLDTIGAWLKRGLLTGFTVGKVTRITEDSMRQLLERPSDEEVLQPNASVAAPQTSAQARPV